MNEPASLDGARIVVARAAGRGDTLCRRIEAAGGSALSLPVIAIEALEQVTLPDGAPDWLVFTSVPAVEHGLRRLPPDLARNARTAAIGNATAEALRSAGIEPDVVPAREESEGLLAEPAFHEMRGRHAWLVKGRGGRELLADTLRTRGAVVGVIKVYERCLPATGAGELLDHWQVGRVDAIVVSSPAGLENLNAMLDAEGREHLRETQLVMPTPRMLKLALEFGIRPVPLIAAGASDDAFMTALSRWWRDRLQDSR